VSGAVFRVISNPARLVLSAFGALIVIGTLLLMLPVAVDGPTGAGLEDALFISTSATTVTGLASVDVTSFSLFGELVILALIQVGGFGVMTIGSVLALVVLRRVGLRQRMLARTEIGEIDIGELARLLWAIFRITVVVEASLALVLFARFWEEGYEGGPAASAYSAVFHSVATFNNAGISLYGDNLARFSGDVFVLLPVSFTFIVGGFGFPVWVEMWRRRPVALQRPAKRGPLSAERSQGWTLHAKLTLIATAVLLVVGPLAVLAFEWRNPATLGDLGVGDKLLAGWFEGVTPRTAGFNVVDTGGMEGPTLFLVTVLMFVGAGSASTSGGIKVTTAAVIAAVIWSEIRGERDVNMLRRRLPDSLVRGAVVIALLSVCLVVTASLALMASDGLELGDALFETASAFGTVGLSTGITGAISTFGHVVLTLLMFAGRVGPVTFAAAFALRTDTRLYRQAEERPIIG